MQHRRLKALSSLLLLALGTPLAAAPLQPLAADRDRVTVSGISSGGYMAGQFHTAFSSLVSGVGIVAAGPYYCAGSSGGPSSLFVLTATTRCMNPCRYAFWPFEGLCLGLMLPRGEALAAIAREQASEGLIDDPVNLADDAVYLFTGEQDHTVVSDVVAENRAFYEALGVAKTAIEYVVEPEAVHAFISDNVSNACDREGAPFINNCSGYDQAHQLLQHLFGPLNENSPSLNGQLIAFEQREFVPLAQWQASALADEGYLFIPEDCAGGGCAVHVAFHGCRQSAAEFADNSVYFHDVAGYNEVADSNGIIVLYPQIRARSELDDTPYNPRGCWDFWGYSGDQFFSREGVQMSAVHGMIKRLLEPKATP